MVVGFMGSSFSLAIVVPVLTQPRRGSHRSSVASCCKFFFVHSGLRVDGMRLGDERAM
jgi:hypothetical protein